LREENVGLLSTTRQWLALPSRIAVLLGLSALSTLAAQAKTPALGTPDNLPRADTGTTGIAIRLEGEQIYLSHDDNDFSSLQLSDTPEDHLLRELLKREGAAQNPAGVMLSPTILAGAGGDGFHWVPINRASGPAQINREVVARVSPTAERTNKTVINADRLAPRVRTTVPASADGANNHRRAVGGNELRAKIRPQP
jgi:hypothetical protein